MSEFLLRYAVNGDKRETSEGNSDIRLEFSDDGELRTVTMEALTSVTLIRSEEKNIFRVASGDRVFLNG